MARVFGHASFVSFECITSSYQLCGGFMLEGEIRPIIG